MPQDDRVSAYIDRAAPFAQPVLGRLRAAVHAAVPEAEETMKWSMPFFQLAGKRLAMMAAFKAHAGAGIFDGTPMGSGEGMGNLGKLTCVDDLPADAELGERLKAAAARIRAGEGGMKRAPAAPKAEIAMPADLAAALNEVPAARTAFDGFPPGARREYLEWVTEAKQAATREKRIATTVEWCALGRRRNWKYEAC